VFVPPENNPEIGSKHVVGNNKTLLISDSCADDIIRIICTKQQETKIKE
jgi:hypothetical protein